MIIIMAIIVVAVDAVVVITILMVKVYSIYVSDITSVDVNLAFIAPWHKVKFPIVNETGRRITISQRNKVQ